MKLEGNVNDCLIPYQFYARVSALFWVESEEEMQLFWADYGAAVGSEKIICGQLLCTVAFKRQLRGW